MSETITIDGCKKINELKSLAKINGKEEMLIDNGENTYKITVDSLLGYIAGSINSGATIAPQPSDSDGNIVIIPEGETLSVSERAKGNIYINIHSSKKSTNIASLNNRIKISPNMGLKIIED